MRRFSCRRSAVGGEVRVAVTGELDILTVPQPDRALRDAQGDAGSVLLDLRGLDFIDSSGAHLLLAADRRICAAGGRLVVVRGSEEVDWFFRLIGLDRELDLVSRPPATASDTTEVLEHAMPKDRARLDKDVASDEEQVSKTVQRR